MNGTEKLIITMRQAMPLRTGKSTSFLSSASTRQLPRARAKLLEMRSNTGDTSGNRMCGHKLAAFYRAGARPPLQSRIFRTLGRGKAGKDGGTVTDGSPDGLRGAGG